MSYPGLPPVDSKELLAVISRAIGVPRFRRALSLTAWAAGYLLLAAAAHHLTAIPGGAAPVWPASGLAVALLAIQGNRFWPLVFACSLLSDYWIAGHSLIGATTVAAGNSAEALIGATIIRKFGAVGDLNRLRDALAFVGASLVSPIPSALLGAWGLHGVVDVSRSGMLQVAVGWWLSDLMGVLMVAPLLTAWFGRRSAPSVPSRYAEFVLIMIATVALLTVCYVYSDMLANLGVTNLPPATFMLPGLIWAVLRLQPRESLAILVFSAVLAGGYTVAYSEAPLQGELLRLQILLFGMAASTVLLIGAITERQQVQAELASKEARFRNVFDQASVGMAMLDEEGRLVAANRRLCETLGYRRDELLGKPLFEVIDPDLLEEEAKRWWKQGAGCKPNSVMERRCHRKDGNTVWLRITSSQLQDVGLAHCISIVEDIGLRHQAEAALRQSEERLRYVTDAADVGYWDWDLTTDRLEWSDRCKAIFGIAQDEEMTYARFICAVDPADEARVMKAVESAIHGGSDYEVEFRVLWPCGTNHWVHSKGRVAFGPSGQPLRMAGVAIDVTARKSMEDAVRRLSQHDALTGLPNRALIYEYAGHLLSQARRGGGRVAFVFVDLDHFKPINDNYGHDAGDAVLREVARRLADCVRGEDFVGRLGGDEFLAVLSHIHHADNAARVASHALRRLDLPIRFGELSLQVSPSIGVAVSPEDGETVDDLIKNADTAMYHAKQAGRNNYQFFRPEMNERAEQARAMEYKLKTALEQGEFQVHFQPVVQLADGRPRAAEALLRWPSAEVGPERFIPAAESAGLMPALGAWVLHEVCRHQRRWLDQGLPFLPVAVNISLNQLSDEHLPDYIRQATQKVGLPAAGLRIELPERAVTGHGVTTDRMLSSLHRMGVKVAVDDFGSGASSINELGHLPLDSLKLDRSFVRAIGRDPAAVPVIDAILALGQSLRLDVVAEGIESEEAFRFLRDKRCPLGQGFFFSHPLPPAEFESWYREAATA